jgi:hypothetical protein
MILDSERVGFSDAVFVKMLRGENSRRIVSFNDNPTPWIMNREAHPDSNRHGPDQIGETVDFGPQLGALSGAVRDFLTGHPLESCAVRGQAVVRP